VRRWLDGPAARRRELVELRSYELVQGQVDAFVDHFETYFLASQEDLGMDIVGMFTVPGDDARFVWVRRFRDPAGRAEALARFYGGPVWKEYGPRANELMVDHTDVHLLVPHPSGPAFAADHVPHSQRAEGGAAGEDEPGTVLIALYDLARAELPVAAISGALADAPAGAVAERGRLVTARVPNEFPRLPVHEGVSIGAWLLADRSGGTAAGEVAEAVAAAAALPVRTMRLAPTARSTLRWDTRTVSPAGRAKPSAV